MAKELNKDEGMISRWSKRKRGLEVEPEEEIVSKEEQDVIDEELEAELLANREAAEEIDLDTINEESDLSIFMKRGVPEELKKQALAILWRSNPIFANIDGLNDYDQDFGDKSLNMKVFKSAWQAGRGYLNEIEEKLDLDEVASIEEQESDNKAASETTNESAGEDDVEEERFAEDEVVAEDDSDNPPEGEPVEVASYDIIDDPQDEEIGTPKVSLRQRLALDG